MDDIDIGKIGKKDEKLIGWDHIRKPIPHTLPAMRARKVKKRIPEKYWLIALSVSIVIILVILLGT